MGVPRAHHWIGACWRTDREGVWRLYFEVEERGVAEAPMGMAGVKAEAREGEGGMEGILCGVSLIFRMRRRKGCWGRTFLLRLRGRYRRFGRRSRIGRWRHIGCGLEGRGGVW